MKNKLERACEEGRRPVWVIAVVSSRDYTAGTRMGTVGVEGSSSRILFAGMWRGIGLG